MKTATIPMAGDVAEFIGSAAEGVENRSLLLDKFAFHKQWPVEEEMTRNGWRIAKWDEASRWSFMRIADGAESVLRLEANEKLRRSRGRDVEPENQERYKSEAKIAETLASVRWESRDSELMELRANHTRQFIGLISKAYDKRSIITIGQLEGRLAINLADSLIQNAGICLDRIFGLPFIPGSAIKGVCRHAALAELKAAPTAQQSSILERFCAVFGVGSSDFKSGELSSFSHLALAGAGDQKGAISFLPAYPLNEAKVVVDLTNVHYPQYYKSGRVEDLSIEEPRLNPFPAVEKGAQFAFCMVLNGINPDSDLLLYAKSCLDKALTELGIGAKTASGYGWFSLRPDILEAIDKEERLKQEIAAKAAAEKAKVEAAATAEKIRKEALSPEQLAAEELLKMRDEEFAGVAKDLAEKDEHWQRAFIKLLLNDKEKRQRWKTWKKKKPNLASGIQTICQKLNIPELP